MHLKSLTLKGFKSFASATTLKLEPGICAVVGPNGSGKSNVVDALAWVMGEQGAKTLRGSSMQDVIFAGAGDRGPLGRAEVTLTIDNHDGRLPIDYSEVSVTRRMFRDGASEYEINGSRARLMDVRELLSDTGIGREMHIIVGQGKLAEILDSRPEERRAYIEEAAGVLKHRRRKEKAQRKLENMQGNLDRLRDLTDELSRQLGPLARQAEAAKRAATVQAAVREARLALAGHEITRVRAALETAEAAHERARLAAAESEEQLAEAAAARETAEAAVAEAEPAAEAAQQLWFRLSTLAERVSATLRVAEERARAGGGEDYHGEDPEEILARAEAADQKSRAAEAEAATAEARLEAVREELDAAEEAYRDAEEEHLAQVRAVADRREGVVRLLAAEESLAARVGELDAEITRAEEREAAAKERAGASAAELATADAAVAEAGGAREPLKAAAENAAAEREAAEKRLEQLRETQRERSGAVYALRSRIETLRDSETGADAADSLDGFSPLAGLITPEPGTETAVAAALGDHAEALAGHVGEETYSSFAGGALARTTLIDTERAGGTWRMDADLPTEATWLLDHIELAEGARAAVTRLLADVVLVADARAARGVVDSDPRLRAVTPDGELFGEGWARLGRERPGTVEVAGQIARAEEELAAAEASLEELAGTLEGARQAAEEAGVEAAAATAELRDHDAAARSAAREAENLKKRAAADARAAETARGQVETARTRRDEARKELEATRDRLARAEDDEAPEEPSTAARDEAATVLEQVRAMEVEARLALRSAQDRAGQVAGRGDQLRRQAEAEKSARTRHERAVAASRARRELAAAVAESAGELAERVAAATGRAAEAREAAAERRTLAQAHQNEARRAEQSARSERDRRSQAAHEAEIKLSQAQVRADETEHTTVERLGVPVADLLAEHTPGEDFDVAAERKRLKQAEKDLGALGKVNPLALEEYKALEERHSYLATQLADVEEARDDLRGVIEDVDARILQLFTDAWHDVAKEFPRVFATLFPGGEGRLVLTDPEDMLGTGIELEARPPGKKVRKLSLLSGGEKSLTALAMLVAIFRARPSPFYVLDEVEAALDDVNLRRLINLLVELRADSQLIVITHQKATMDVANVLYGVTMRGDGVTRVISQRMQPAGWTGPAESGAVSSPDSAPAPGAAAGNPVPGGGAEVPN